MSEFEEILEGDEADRLGRRPIVSTMPVRKPSPRNEGMIRHMKRSIAMVDEKIRDFVEQRKSAKAFLGVLTRKWQYQTGGAKRHTWKTMRILDLKIAEMWRKIESARAIRAVWAKKVVRLGGVV